MLQLPAASQNISIPRKDALRVLAAADSNKISKQHIALLIKDTAILGSRIRELKGAITTLNVINESYKKDSANYARIIQLTEDQKSLAVSEANAWEKAYKKEKRKRFWTGISGAVLTGVAILIKSR